jgi:uncharacterized protein YegP (UPF0339 family)
VLLHARWDRSWQGDVLERSVINRPKEGTTTMYFQLMYHTTNGDYHARLYNANGQLLMWTHSSRNKQTVIDWCSEVMRAGVNVNTPIYDTKSYS